MTRTPKAASAARTGPSTTDSDTAARAPAAAAAEAAPLAGGGDVEETASAVDATLVAEPPQANSKLVTAQRTGTLLLTVV